MSKQKNVLMISFVSPTWFTNLISQSIEIEKKIKRGFRVL